jgi:hypothetical protein
LEHAFGSSLNPTRPTVSRQKHRTYASSACLPITYPPSKTKRRRGPDRSLVIPDRLKRSKTERSRPLLMTPANLQTAGHDRHISDFRLWHLPRQSFIRMDLMPLTKTVSRASLALDTQHGVLLRGWLHIRTGHLVSCLRYDSILESTARAFGRATTQSANEIAPNKSLATRC